MGSSIDSSKRGYGQKVTLPIPPISRQTRVPRQRTVRRRQLRKSGIHCQQKIPPIRGPMENVGQEIEYPTIGGPPVQSVTELLRFDATPPWVMANWKKVSTHLADLDMRGMRVPRCHRDRR